MLNLLDKLLDKLTMYKLLMYYLIALLLAAAGLSAFGYLEYKPFDIIFSGFYLVFICQVSNWVFAYGWDAPFSSDSSIITGLILALIINPYQNPHSLIFMTAAAGLAIASKYMLAIKNKHTFNPAAIAVVLTAIGAGNAASWWIGNQYLLPLVVLGGLLIVRKIEREALLLSFLAGATISVGVLAILNGHPVLASLKTTALHSSLFFLAFVMLTEPATSPGTKRWRIVYGALAGLIFSPLFHIGPIYSTPERDLVVANIFAFLVSPLYKLDLRLKSKHKTSASVADFVFELPEPVNYKPGQYMEWTLPHEHQDLRGNRRYFTLASSPTEPELRVGVKFFPNGSSYKKAMLSMTAQTQVAAGQLGGDFTLPDDPRQKLAFIAGGIGVTPFRSMAKYLADRHEHRDAILVYSENSAPGFAYKDIFASAQSIGLKTIYTVTGDTAGWSGRTGVVSAEMIAADIPDYHERLFYISGPQPMVHAVKSSLRQLGVAGSQIKTDFFPGYA